MTVAALLFATYLACLVTYALSPLWLLYSVAYLLLAILLPGYLLAAVLHRLTSPHTDAPPPDAPTEIALATVFGLGVCLASYLAAILLALPALNLAFALTYAAGLHPGVVRDARTALRRFDRSRLGTPATAFSLFVLAVGIPIMMMRPTPGLVPIDIFQDHLWNASNTVALAREFPLHSLNIETRPAIAYHVLVHVLGAHLSLVTGIPAHLTGLQYVYVPLTVLLVLNAIAVLRPLLGEQQRYLLFGAAVLFFGSGFTLLHEIKVGGLLNSSTNLIGIVAFLAWVGLQARTDQIAPTLRTIAIFAAVFLATVAKGSVGAGLAGGTMLWFVVRAWKRDVPAGGLAEVAGASAGFLLSYLVFFSSLVVAADNAPPARELLEGQSFSLTPFAYVAQNPLLRGSVSAIDHFLSGPWGTAGYALLIALLLPIHVLLYYSYRLLPFLGHRETAFTYLEKRLLFVFLSAALVAYLVPGAPTDHAYFLAPGLFGLDLIFVSWAYRVSLLDRLAQYFRSNIFGFIGAVTIIVIPFASGPGWFRPEYALNFVAFGHVGRLLDAELAGTSYRRDRSTITPALYEAMQHIRTNLPPSTIVVTPFIHLADGRPMAYFTSALSERTAYLEGYAFAVSDAVPEAEIEARLAVVSDLYDRQIVADSLRDGRHVVLCSVECLETAERAWRQASYEIDYRNADWGVVRLLPVSR